MLGKKKSVFICRTNDKILAAFTTPELANAFCEDYKKECADLVWPEAALKAPDNMEVQKKYGGKEMSEEKENVTPEVEEKEETKPAEAGTPEGEPEKVEGSGDSTKLELEPGQSVA